MSLGFPCLTPLVESFSTDLLRVIKNYWAEPYLEPHETSTMKLFCKNSQNLKDTHKENTPSNKAEAFTKSMNMYIWEIS